MGSKYTGFNVSSHFINWIYSNCRVELGEVIAHKRVLECCTYVGGVGLQGGVVIDGVVIRFVELLNAKARRDNLEGSNSPFNLELSNLQVRV